MERAKGFEPSTPTLARLCSTPELHPHPWDDAGRVVGAICRKRSDIATGLRRSFFAKSFGAKWRFARQFLRRCAWQATEAALRKASRPAILRATAARISPASETGRRNATGGTHSFSSHDVVGEKSADLIDVTLQGFRAEVMEESTAPSGSGRFLGALVRSLQAIDPDSRKSRQGGARQNPPRQDEYRRISPNRGETGRSSPFPPSSPSRAARWSTALWARCPRARSRLSSNAASGRPGEDVEALFGEAQALLEAGDVDAAEPAFMHVLTSSIQTMPALRRASPAFCRARRAR